MQRPRDQSSSTISMIERLARAIGAGALVPPGGLGGVGMRRDEVVVFVVVVAAAAAAAAVVAVVAAVSLFEMADALAPRLGVVCARGGGTGGGAPWSRS